MKTARKIVLDLLVKMSEDGAYSNIILDNTFSQNNLTKNDKNFATALFYGVLERKITLDYIIKQYSNMPFDKISIDVLNILRMGIYQLVYMNSIPDSAAVNESVKLSLIMRKTSVKSFVNAILRSFIRDGKKLKINEKEESEILSVKYSCPVWLVEKWIEDYSSKTTEEMLISSLGRPPLFIRANTTKCKTIDLIEELKKERISCEETPLITDCLSLSNIQGIEKINAFRKGMFHVQDISSQLCCRALHPIFNETIVDICAAPGGKSFTIAEMMSNRGKVFSYDLYDGRVAMIENGLTRLGLSIIKPSVNNALEYNENIPLADKVLCDVPCSGFGVIRRKPEIKYKNKDSFSDLPEIQYNILKNSSKYVKLGGTLVYSTCTLNKQENDDIVDRFLNEHEEFSPIVVPNILKESNNSHKVTILPNQTGGDGFFIATLRKTR